MNAEKMMALANRFCGLKDATENKFDIRTGVSAHSCGTVACIAGWTTVWSGRLNNCVDADPMRPFNADTKVWKSVREQAAEELDLSSSQADRLFTPSGFTRMEYSHSDAVGRAVTGLRIMARTGTLPEDWWRMPKEELLKIHDEIY